MKKTITIFLLLVVTNIAFAQNALTAKQKEDIKRIQDLTKPQDVDDDDVKLFENGNFGGNFQNLSKTQDPQRQAGGDGKYNRLNSGLFRKVSSIKVGKKCRLKIWDLQDCENGGGSLIILYPGNYADIGSEWNDRFESAQVETISSDEPFITLFWHANFQGPFQNIGEGMYGCCLLFNDQTSSLVVPEGLRATLFENAMAANLDTIENKGRRKTFTPGTEGFLNSFNDNVTAVAVLGKRKAGYKLTGIEIISKTMDPTFSKAPEAFTGTGDNSNGPNEVNKTIEIKQNLSETVEIETSKSWDLGVGLTVSASVGVEAGVGGSSITAGLETALSSTFNHGWSEGQRKSNTKTKEFTATAGVPIKPYELGKGQIVMTPYRYIYKVLYKYFDTVNKVNVSEEGNLTVQSAFHSEVQFTDGNVLRECGPDKDILYKLQPDNRIYKSKTGLKGSKICDEPNIDEIFWINERLIRKDKDKKLYAYNDKNNQWQNISAAVSYEMAITNKYTPRFFKDENGVVWKDMTDSKLWVPIQSNNKNIYVNSMSLKNGVIEMKRGDDKATFPVKEEKLNCPKCTIFISPINPPNSPAPATQPSANTAPVVNMVTCGSANYKLDNAGNILKVNNATDAGTKVGDACAELFCINNQLICKSKNGGSYWKYSGTAGKWENVSNLFTIAIATNRYTVADNGEVFESKNNGSWIKIGGDAKSPLEVVNNKLVCTNKNNNTKWQYSGTPNSWSPFK